MRPRSLLATVLATLSMTAVATAEIKMPAIFTPHMVLQRDQKDRVWGWAEPGESIKVAINGQSKSAEADKDGKWTVTLDPMPAGGPFTMTVEGKSGKKTIDDILVGEVWLCSGQSNMQMAVGQSDDADIEVLTAKYPKIRLISVPQVGTQEPRKDFNGSWQVCTPQSVRDFSAVAYYFGRQIYETIDVPIGLIDDSWGGSACEAWVRRDLLENDPRFKTLMSGWAKREADLPAAREAFEKRLEAHKEAVAKAKSAGKTAPRRPNSPEDDMKGNQRPANIYNGVLKPTIGYGMRGVIWYQGESNAGRAYEYRDLFPFMIKSWRDEWAIGDFPFYFVQLADFMQETDKPGDSSWAELREAQTMTMSKLPNTGEAVIIDIGEAQDIHPKNKQDVGKRLARWALAKDYGVKVAYQSPTYKSMEVKDGKAILTFDHVGTGLKAFDVPEVSGFTVAGSDHTFVNATAKIVGKNKVEVSAKGVTDPVSVRYAWANNPVCNVYSGEGLPLTPFRTDDWPGVTAPKK